VDDLAGTLQSLWTAVAGDRERGLLLAAVALVYASGWLSSVLADIVFEALGRRRVSSDQDASRVRAVLAAWTPPYRPRRPGWLLVAASGVAWLAAPALLLLRFDLRASVGAAVAAASGTAVADWRRRRWRRWLAAAEERIAAARQLSASMPPEYGGSTVVPTKRAVELFREADTAPLAQGRPSYEREVPSTDA
jgi:MFS family permease